MGKKNKQAKNKKRKDKKKPVSLAYTGNKYRKQEFVEAIMRAETGILEAHVINERKLTDHTVYAALERFIIQMRRGELGPFDPAEITGPLVPTEEDFVIWSIRRNWEDLCQTRPRLGRDTQVGILRTILGSIDVRKSVSPTSRSYLQYIEGFLAKLGVSVDKIKIDSSRASALESAAEWRVSRLPTDVEPD